MWLKMGTPASIEFINASKEKTVGTTTATPSNVFTIGFSTILRTTTDEALTVSIVLFANKEIFSCNLLTTEVIEP